MLQIARIKAAVISKNPLGGSKWKRTRKIPVRLLVMKQKEVVEKQPQDQQQMEDVKEVCCDKTSLELSCLSPE